MKLEEERRLIEILVERFAPFMNELKMESMIPKLAHEDDLVQRAVRQKLEANRKRQKESARLFTSC